RCEQGDLIGLQIAVFESRDLALRRAQLEEQFLLDHFGANLYKRTRVQNVILDRSPDPPDRVGGKAEASFGLKAIQCQQQADIAFGDDLRNRQTVAPVAHGDLDRETQMTADKLVRGITIAMVAPTCCKRIFLVLLQHRETPDIVEIAPAAPASDERRFAPCWRGEARKLSLDTHVVAPSPDQHLRPMKIAPTTR